MKRLADERPELHDVKVVYADLDGTILGPGGSLFAAADGSTSLAAPEALRALRDAGIALVVMSGRTRRSAEVARTLGAEAYIAELGAIVVESFVPEHVVRNYGAYSGNGSPAEAIARSGAAALLLERYPGKLEPVAPWSEATLQLHGHVDVLAAAAALDEAGYGWLEIHDNGRLSRTYANLDVTQTHAYILSPRGVSKASGVRLHRRRRGITPDQAIGVGDSPADLLVAAEVGAFFLVANGVGGLGDATWPANAYVTAAERGEGFAEAVATVLS